MIAALEAQGATVVDPTDIDLSATVNEFPALLCEFKTDIATYLETYVHGTNPVTGQPYPQTLADLIAFDQAHPEPRGTVERRRLRGSPRRRTAVTPIAPRCARRRRRPCRPRSIELMAANHLDAIIALTNGPAWPTNDNPNEGDLNGHFEYFVGSSAAAAVSGYPDITVPAGYDAGLPLGITFIGPRWGEPKLLGLAYDFEQATHVRVAAAVHPDDRRRAVPRRPESTPVRAGATTAGEPQPVRSRRAVPLEARRSRAQRSLADRPGFVIEVGQPARPPTTEGVYPLLRRNWARKRSWTCAQVSSSRHC